MKKEFRSEFDIIPDFVDLIDLYNYMKTQDKDLDLGCVLRDSIITNITKQIEQEENQDDDP